MRPDRYTLLGLILITTTLCVAPLLLPGPVGWLIDHAPTILGIAAVYAAFSAADTRLRRR